MEQNPKTYLPTTSGPPSSLVPTATSHAWASLYRGLNQNAAQAPQYSAQGGYLSSSTSQDYYTGSTGLPAAQAAAYQQALMQQHGFAPTVTSADNMVDDPLPPGNEEIEIPGLTGSSSKTTTLGQVHALSGMQSQQELYQQYLQTHMHSKGKEVTTVTPMWPGMSTQPISDPRSQKEMSLRYLQQQNVMAQQQYETVVSARRTLQMPAANGRPTPTLSAGFNFKNPQANTTANQTASVPFLIKPGIPEKPKTSTAPAYMPVLPPERPEDQMMRTENNSVRTGSVAKLLTLSADQPTQRKRRKFEKGPPPSKPLDIESLEEELKKQERGARFSQPMYSTPSFIPEEPKHKTKLIGQCLQLEKSYFRLSGRPDPSVVRPEPVLERALARLVDLLRRREVDYFYAADQFKGMRQDCTVQQLQSETCVRIYEASARAHLEYGEIWEYNQCQSNLETLYKQGIPGCRSEFVAYRILYQVLHINKGEAILMNKTIRTLTQQDRAAPEVRHALQLTSALLANNLREVFRLYVKAPFLVRALIDHVLDEIRYKAARLFIKSIRLKEPVELMIEELGFYCRDVGLERTSGLIPPGCMNAVYRGLANVQANREAACVNCCDWLRAHGAVLVEGEMHSLKEGLDCFAGTSGAASEVLIDPVASRSKLFKAKAENAVAHGDPNLNMSYFLVK